MSWLICTSIVILRLKVCPFISTFISTCRIIDFIAENKEAIEEKAGVDEVGAAAVDTGFATGGGDWEVSGAGAAAFGAGATATPAAPGAGWDAGAEEWSAAPAQGTTTEWGAADATKTSEW